MNQRSTKYETALMGKINQPIDANSYDSMFALPFGFLQQRSGGKFLKMFIGISIGIGLPNFKYLISSFRSY